MTDSQGSGKSATIRTIMNRPAIPHLRALTLIKEKKDMDAREREKYLKVYINPLFVEGMPFQLISPMASWGISEVSCNVNGKYHQLFSNS